MRRDLDHDMDYNQDLMGVNSFKLFYFCSYIIVMFMYANRVVCLIIKFPLTLGFPLIDDMDLETKKYRDD